MKEPVDPVDPMRCPLCGNANECGMANDAGKCWCFTAIISEKVLARVPEGSRNVACICANCAKQGTT
jgi:hypothetical protein